jgi:hypothetical protein
VTPTPPTMTNTLRIEPFLGHITEHAAILVRIADAVGCEVREDFNGDDLVALPGNLPQEVCRRLGAVPPGASGGQQAMSRTNASTIIRRALEAWINKEAEPLDPCTLDTIPGG